MTDLPTVRTGDTVCFKHRIGLVRRISDKEVFVGVVYTHARRGREEDFNKFLKSEFDYYDKGMQAWGMQHVR